MTYRRWECKEDPDNRSGVDPTEAQVYAELRVGDCLAVMSQMPAESVDAIVTDPPYGLEFMGKEWDAPWKGNGRWGRDDSAFVDRPKGGSSPFEKRERPKFSAGPLFQAWCEEWARECLRVLKPGGHMLAFGGTRTWHRLACAVEDAGFEIRDSIFWIYGSGFPKSLNVGKDSRFCQCQAVPYNHADVDLPGVRGAVPPPASDGPASEVADLLSSVQREAARPGMGDARPQGGSGAADEHSVARGAEPGVERWGDVQAGPRQLRRPEVRPVSTGVRVDGASGRVRGRAPASHGAVDRSITDPDGVRESRQPRPTGQPAGESGPLADERGSQTGRGWPVCAGCGKPRVTGLGTALKPSAEPIVVARKPLAGTVAANVLAHGTGALNIAACRIQAVEPLVRPAVSRNHNDVLGKGLGAGTQTEPAGRWPTNVVLDGDAADALDRESGTLKSGDLKPYRSPSGKRGGIMGETVDRAHDYTRSGDEGGASRFFPVFRYQAKAPARERPKVDGVVHPTVKPVELMRWLVRLVCQPGGTILDPFAGSGTTGEAAMLEGVTCLLVEDKTEYLPLIEARMARVSSLVDEGGT